MNHHAVDFLHTLCDQHLILLIVVHDGVGDLVVSDQRIDIAVGGHVVLDLLIGRIVRLQVFARIVFRWFQLLDWHLLQLHIRLVQKAKASWGYEEHVREGECFFTLCRLQRCRCRFARGYRGEKQRSTVHQNETAGGSET